MTKTIALIFSIFALTTTFGCGEVEARIDCNDICSDYEACVGEDTWDFDECVSKCEEEPNSDIDTCDVCLDSEGMGCIECTLECAPLAV